MITSQSFAGANNNEKQDLNRSIGIQFSVRHAPPPTASSAAEGSSSVFCEPSSPGHIAQMCSPGCAFFPPWAETDMQKEKGRREMRKSFTDTAWGEGDALGREVLARQAWGPGCIPRNPQRKPSVATAIPVLGGGGQRVWEARWPSHRASQGQTLAWKHGGRD